MLCGRCGLSYHSDAQQCCALQVKDWIAQMKRNGQAYYSGNFYLLAGVLLQKVSERQPAAADMTDGLLALMTALK